MLTGVSGVSPSFPFGQNGIEQLEQHSIGESRLCARRGVCHGARVAVFLGGKRTFAVEIGECSGPTPRARG